MKKYAMAAILVLSSLAIESETVPVFAQVQQLQRMAGVAAGIPAQLSRAQGGKMRNGLPPTNLDSFVYESGAHAWHIYGDEGCYGLPPFQEFTKVHRIETGITGRRQRGLTTGHGSLMPDAWGGDEFVDGQEWSQSGAGGTRTAYQPTITNNMEPEANLLTAPDTQDVQRQPQMKPQSFESWKQEFEQIKSN